MTSEEVIEKIQEARKAIEQYKKELVRKAYSVTEHSKVQDILQESTRLITEAKTLGAAGEVCPRCGGSGRL